MSSSAKALDPVFQGAGQRVGIEIWRIENFQPVPLPKSEHGKFYMGDSYIVLQTTQNRGGAYLYDIHFWIGKDTSQDEAGTAAIKTVELDAVIGGRAVQHREIQDHESDKFLSYFKPCIIPLEGGIASGFTKVEEEEFETRLYLYVCKGKRVVRMKQVPFALSSLNHDDVFILDTKNKIFQFNGANSNIQEREKASEVIQFLKEKYHDETCDVAIVDDGKLDTESDSAEAKSENAFSETDGSQEVPEVKETGEAPASESNGDDSEPKQETLQYEIDSESSQSTFSYDQLRTKSENPVTGIDFKRREAYLSDEEFQTIFGMMKDAFYQLPKWKQDMQKKKADLF